MAESDKRRFDRTPMFKVCRYTIAGRAYADLSTNISGGGIFIKNFSPPPIGTEVTLVVTLPEDWGNLPLKVVGRVVHVNDDTNPHRRGMGIEFTQVVADSLPIIEYFIREVYKEKNLKQDQLTERPATGEDGHVSFEYMIVGDGKKDPAP
jgi:uncharacterized protein (TIGR02266 family)